MAMLGWRIMNRAIAIVRCSIGNSLRITTRHMDLTFEKGTREEPKGHAFLYFRNSMDRDEIWATYLVMLPINVDVTKYVPPFLMSQMGDLGPKDLSAFAFPPAPELLESFAYLEDLAEAREDDIIFGGSINPTDVTSTMMLVSDTVQKYADVYTRLASAMGANTVVEGNTSDGPGEALSPGYGVNEVLYGLMTEGDRLNELTKLVGRLRFAIEGGEVSLAREAEFDISLLSKNLPDDHRTAALVELIKSPGENGEELANLYLQRCFHVVNQEYVELGKIEERIRLLESGSPADEAD